VEKVWNSSRLCGKEILLKIGFLEGVKEKRKEKEKKTGFSTNMSTSKQQCKKVKLFTCVFP
jgi:hypothetical protein